MNLARYGTTIWRVILAAWVGLAAIAPAHLAAQQDATQSEPTAPQDDASAEDIAGPEYLPPIEQTPYVLSFRIAFRDDPACTARFRTDLIEQLQSTLWATMSIQWRCFVEGVDVPLASARDWLRNVRPADYADELERYDKIVFCYVSPDIDRWRIELRELDLTFLQLGPIFRASCREPGQLARVITETAYRAFTPQAAVDEVRGRRVVIRVKASELKLFDSRMRLVQPGSVFRPFRPRIDPDTGEETAVPVHWAFLVVTEVRGGKAVCQLVTAVRGAVPPPAQDPADIQLLGVKSNGEASVLTIVERESGQPVVAMEVEARTLAERFRRPLGTTDFEGRIVVPPATSLQLLYLKQGKRFVAILPVLPGSGPLPVARVPTFEERLELEGRAAALQEEVVDYVVERTVLLNTLKALMDKEEWDKAGKVVQQLERLPGKDYFIKKLEQLQQAAQQLAGEGKPVPGSVRRLLDETQKLIERYVDPAVIKEAIDDYRSLREE